jgi:hypothetical protein
MNFWPTSVDWPSMLNRCRYSLLALALLVSLWYVPATRLQTADLALNDCCTCCCRRYVLSPLSTWS